MNKFFHSWRCPQCHLDNTTVRWASIATAEDGNGFRPAVVVQCPRCKYVLEIDIDVKPCGVIDGSSKE
jgi:phage FluMu protein Com